MPSAAVATAKYGERFTVNLQGQQVDVPYLVTKATKRDEARAAIMAVAPGTITGYAASGTGPTLVLTEVSADEEVANSGIWNGTARYGIPTVSQQKTTGESSFQFETGGGTQHITQSLKTISRTACAGAGGSGAPNYGGAINVNGDGDVGGCDIVAPVFRFSVTAYFAKTAITASYLGNLYKLVGNVNTSSVNVTINGFTMTFAAGELLYEGASGGMRGDTDWEITFRLAGSPNVDDVCANWDASVKPASAVPKKGWEYAWVVYQPSIDATALAPVRKPLAIYIEQVYPTGNLTLLNVP